MPPHPALGIGEILALIFEELRDDRKSLAICARTCKLFLEPVLNVLWRRLDDSYPWVGMMLGEKRVGRARLEYYTKRVQIMGSGGGEAAQRLRSFYCGIASAIPGYDLFPSVHTLGVSGEIQFSLSVRLPRSLRTLEVHFEQGENESNNAALYILSAISQTPLLEHLVLAGTVYHPMILMHIASFNHLRSLDLLNLTFIPSSQGRPIIQDGLRMLLGMESTKTHLSTCTRCRRLTN